MPVNMLIKQNKKLGSLSKKLSVIGDGHRLKILCIIFNKKFCCVSDIGKELKLHIAVVSHHLQVLTDAKLLTSKREGKRICYSVVHNSFTNDLKQLICKYN